MGQIRKRMILHISKYFPPYVGGIEEAVYYNCSALKDYSHYVLCFNGQKKGKVDRVGNIVCVRSGWFWKVAGQPLSVLMFFTLFRLLRRRKFDIVQFNAPHPLMSFYLVLLYPYLRLRGVKTTVFWHADFCMRELRSIVVVFLFYPLLLLQLLLADRIIATSSKVIKESLFLRFVKRKCVCVPLPVNEIILAPQPGDDERIKALRQKYDGRKIVFAVARHVYYKGYDYLIKAAKRIREDAVFVIAGSGPQTPYLKKLAEDCPKVFFPGRISDEEKRIYLYAAWIYAFPSVSNAEAFGIALAEGMYCGLPAVTFPIHASGVNWVSLNGETCIECRHQDVGELAEALEKLLKNDDFHAELAKKSFTRAHKYFTLSNFSQSLSNLYLELLSAAQ